MRDFAGAERLGVVVQRPGTTWHAWQERMTQTNYSLRLQTGLKAEAERVAKSEETTLNQFINIAVAEKLSALRTADYFCERAVRARPGEAEALLESFGDDSPAREGDEVDVVAEEQP